MRRTKLPIDVNCDRPIANGSFNEHAQNKTKRHICNAMPLAQSKMAESRRLDKIVPNPTPENI